MNWWEETEARALRAKTPALLAQVLWQRFQAARLDPDLAYLPAYQLAQLHDLCADLIKLVESVLLTGDGDRTALRRLAILLAAWARSAHFWTETSAPAFNQLLDSLDLEADLLTQREALEPDEDDLPPEEQPKLDGRYQNWHLLYERLDLKLASIELDEKARRGLARSIARVYEQALVTLRIITGLEKETSPRFGAVTRLILEVNTTWHFDLGPYHLGHGALRPSRSSVLGLQTWLLVAFSE